LIKARLSRSKRSGPFLSFFFPKTILKGETQDQRSYRFGGDEIFGCYDANSVGKKKAAEKKPAAKSEDGDQAGREEEQEEVAWRSATIMLLDPAAHYFFQAPGFGQSGRNPAVLGKLPSGKSCQVRACKLARFPEASPWQLLLHVFCRNLSPAGVVST